MDYRCPCCGKDLGTRKQVHAIIARMELDCVHCKSRIRLNIHPLEERIVFVSFGSFLVLALLAWMQKSEALTALALVAGAVAPLVLPLIERTWLKTWTRYAPAKPGGERA